MIALKAAAALLAASLRVGAAPPQVAPDAPVARPTGASIPANLLRLSLRFARRPTGPVLARVGLRRGTGDPIAQPFLDQELWSPDGRTLTILMHPGRVKTGLIANERLGRALEPGETVILTVDGRPVRRWRVGAPDLSPPTPAIWRVNTPRAFSNDPLEVSLDGPVDALDVDLIAVRAPDGRRVPGTATLEAGETRWRFHPRGPWRTGRYVVVGAPELEDPAGNRPGQDFEHAPGASAPMTDGPAFEPIATRGGRR